MAAVKVSTAVARFGATAPGAKGRELRAGAINALLDNGQLRYIRVNGVEVLRAIAWLVRDENWGTFTPSLRNLRVKTTPEGFDVSYRATIGSGDRMLAYEAKIAANRKGTLEFTVECTPTGDFLTNRTGFIVLHPLQGVAGEKVNVEHVDGRKVKAKFPALINPVQPFRNIRALTHEVMPGLTATCRMEGDSFEMEDHRNWMDASFKTYVRPLADPWPYVLKAGESFVQRVSLTLHGNIPRPARPNAGAAVTVRIGAAGRLRMPAIGLALTAAEAQAAAAAAPLVKAMGVRHLLVTIDGRDRDFADALPHHAALAKACGGEVSLEILLPGKRPPADELGPIARAARPLRPVAAAVYPAGDMKATLPGSKGAEAPSAEAICAAARAAFPDARIGGGVPAFFTELNRQRPPPGLFDFITHTTSSIVHAADDLSVMETLQTPPYIGASVKAFAGKAAYRVGPGGIGARDNPYGAAASPNPDNARVCLAQADPRQRGLFGAAFTLGYAAAFAGTGVEALVLGAATGPLGAIATVSDTHRPWFDECDARLHPLYHVLRSLASAHGAPLLATQCSDPKAIAVLACRQPRKPGRRWRGMHLWIANLTSRRQGVTLAKPLHEVDMATLDERSFARLTTDADFLSAAARRIKRLTRLTLAPYAVALIAETGHALD